MANDKSQNDESVQVKLLQLKYIYIYSFGIWFVKSPYMEKRTQNTQD